MTLHVNLIECVEREIRLRQRAYPHWVARGRMSQAKADAEISLMQEVLAFLHAHAPKPVPPAQGEMFGGGT
jgi:hypothetical protein